MKKIIGFDSWTAGRHHFIRLVPALKSLGYDLILIHIGSWGHDTEQPVEEHCEGLIIRDISYYGKCSFNDILTLEKPMAVLFLSTRAFAHEAFNRYATHLGIPTIHLYHGLVNVQHVGSNATTYHVNWINQIRLIGERLWKNVAVLWPVYWMALIKTRASYANWYWFLREVLLKATSGAWGIAPPDASTTAGCVYTNADITHMAVTYGVPQDRIFAVGNPDLARFGLGQELIGSCLIPGKNNQYSVMYIETALVDSGLVFANKEEFTDHLMTTKAYLGGLGFGLTIKPHPATIKSGIRDHLKKSGLDICPDEEFLPRLQSAVAVIVEPSTAAMIPALLGLPIFLASYGKLAGQLYGPVMMEYPKAVKLDQIDQLDELLKRIQGAINKAHFKKWVEDNAGPLPAEDMPCRVAAVIDQVVKKSTK